MKTTTNTLLAVFILLAASCTKETLNTPQAAIAQTPDGATAQTTAHFIGERFGGGVIFYIDATGKHGYIADTVDQAPAMWYNGVYTITGVTGTDLGNGKSNTHSIVLLQGKAVNYAALECSKSKRNGFTDWYLPSRDELYQLFLQQSLVGPFSYGFYYTSSEIHDSSLFAWGIYFYSGAQFGSQKNAIGFVRAIRNF